MIRPTVVLALGALALSSSRQCIADEQSEFAARVYDAVERALPLIEVASAETAENRRCFTCHGQAMPVVALVESQQHGFHIDSENLRRQIDHTYAHLERSTKQYSDGRGTGGQVDTAGWALWALEAALQDPDRVTEPVIQYLLGKQNTSGVWKCSSDRPPSEKSHFATSYLALRAFETFGQEPYDSRIEAARAKATKWFEKANPKDTEDRVFQLLSLPYVDLDDLGTDLADELCQQQRSDGGWSQLPGMDSDAYATATVLYALSESGMDSELDSYRRGLEYLLDQQLSDGSWHVTSRSKPFQTYFETGYPHGKDQFISTTAACWSVLAMLHSLPKKSPAEIITLEGTEPIVWPESDLSGRIMIGAHKFIDSQIDVANKKRRKLKIDNDDRTQLRSELKTVVGVVEERLPPRLELYGDEKNPSLVAESSKIKIYQVRWPVFENIFGEGLYVQQKDLATGRCIVVPDADQTPEQLLGIQNGLSPKEQIAARLASSGVDILIPTIISRRELETKDSRTKAADMTEREWVYRQAFHMGRHVIGYDVQRILGAVDFFAQQNSEMPIGIAGYGEGGLLAFHAAAIDERIDATLISGCFDKSDASWSEPIYRNIWRRSIAHGNAEVASLILPRALYIEHSEFPSVVQQKGSITTPKASHVRSEFRAIRVSEDAQDPQIFVGDDSTVDRWSDNAFAAFLSSFDVTPASPTARLSNDRRADASARIAERQTRCMLQVVEHVQSLVRGSEHVRDKFYLYEVKPEWENRRWSTKRSHETQKPESFIAASTEFRKRFSAQAIGRFDVPMLPPNARSRKVAETENWTAFDVVLDVHDSLVAWGVLVVPKDIAEGERRPVVVCQHGRNGVPRDTLNAGKTAYNDFAAKLAERGFVTFAPHNLYRGEDRYRWLDRKANAIGCTLFSFILASHEQTLNWLDTLPFVDGDRIAFYGLSYGGETAVRVPTILERYCLSICSGDFNQWTRKVASIDQPFSFMGTIEWEMPYWNLGHTFDYAEMTYLMFPRPFMVERGHHDGVGRDRWVAHEFAKVRWLYAQFGLSDKVAIEYFQGGHSINAVGSFAFLHKHLRWPPPDSPLRN